MFFSSKHLFAFEVQENILIRHLQSLVGRVRANEQFFKSSLFTTYPESEAMGLDLIFSLYNFFFQIRGHLFHMHRKFSEKKDILSPGAQCFLCSEWMIPLKASTNLLTTSCIFYMRFL